MNFSGCICERKRRFSLWTIDWDHFCLFTMFHLQGEQVVKSYWRAGVHLWNHCNKYKLSCKLFWWGKKGTKVVNEHNFSESQIDKQLNLLSWHAIKSFVFGRMKCVFSLSLFKWYCLYGKARKRFSKCCKVGEKPEVVSWCTVRAEGCLGWTVSTGFWHWFLAWVKSKGSAVLATDGTEVGGTGRVLESGVRVLNYSKELEK